MGRGLVVLVQVNTRLRKEDVVEIKRRALEAGVPWQALLRVIVSHALKTKPARLR